MMKFWTWLKHFAQRRLDETPGSMRCGPYELTADYRTFEIFARHLGDPDKNLTCVTRL